MFRSLYYSPMKLYLVVYGVYQKVFATGGCIKGKIHLGLMTEIVSICIAAEVFQICYNIILCGTNLFQYSFNIGTDYIRYTCQPFFEWQIDSDIKATLITNKEYWPNPCQKNIFELIWEIDHPLDSCPKIIHKRRCIRFSQSCRVIRIHVIIIGCIVLVSQ